MKTIHIFLIVPICVAIAVAATDRAQACTLGVVRVGASSTVPSSTTADKVAAFIVASSPGRAAKYQSPASVRQLVDLYVMSAACPSRRNGACLPIRWDYAVFQMLHETNYLRFDGGVRPADNNFAGIGATVSGKRGELFPDIATGVMGHVQHLLMYTGVIIDKPVAKRTALVQGGPNGVVAKMQALGREITVCDVGRGGWSGTDPKTYGSKVQNAACRFDKRYCP